MLNHRENLLFELGAGYFIRIKVEHPVMFEPAMFQAKIALFSEVHEAVLKHARPAGSGDFHRAVRAKGIQDENIVRPINRGEATSKVGLFVKGEDEDGNHGEAVISDQ
jgi:hypothetical protein